MDIDDFVKLPARQAAELYSAARDAGDDAEASRLHQAYFEAHRVRLSADRQVAEAMVVRPPPNTGAARSAAHQRSTIRRVGIVLTALGVAFAMFSMAAGIGGTGLAFGLAFTSTGFMLWLVGVVEDRLIEIRQAVATGPTWAAVGAPHEAPRGP
ncbi:hypothetical protein JKL49_01065 [Phenylobacterium sp. 20VBR1]|uniref:Uncharacterized protein n=1 Tax=Phenylobacterium glaciei TaxID=2803784 RepID=A0A941D074_9CAUL|nr:hypothetical protein [Phenylobacterium glaciei]MBR7617963.1 hypothetical protein [Phenylobacterium glaciei]